MSIKHLFDTKIYYSSESIPWRSGSLTDIPIDELTSMQYTTMPLLSFLSGVASPETSSSAVLISASGRAGIKTKSKLSPCGISSGVMSRPSFLYSQNSLETSSMVNVLKFPTLFFFCSQTILSAGYQGWNSQNACQKTKQGRP